MQLRRLSEPEHVLVQLRVPGLPADATWAIVSREAAPWTELWL